MPTPQPLSPSQRDIHLRIFENKRLEFLARVHDACNANSGQMPLTQCKQILASIGLAEEEGEKLEMIVGTESMTPLWFELDAALAKFREHLTTAMRAAEQRTNQ